MKAPVIQKLKSDAEEVLAEVWRAMRPQAPGANWRDTPIPPDLRQGGSLERPASPSGLCYFHLN